MTERKTDWVVSFESVRKQQEADIARLTTPAQRFQWLEEAFEALSPFIERSSLRSEPDAMGPGASA